MFLPTDKYNQLSVKLIFIAFPAGGVATDTYKGLFSMHRQFCRASTTHLNKINGHMQIIYVAFPCLRGARPIPVFLLVLCRWLLRGQLALFCSRTDSQITNACMIVLHITGTSY
jgi:hypothetical protein